MTNETKHTAEPWQVEPNESIVGANGGTLVAEPLSLPWRRMAVVTDVQRTFINRMISESQANARRIVACVNACAGITDNELTHGPAIAIHKFSYVVNEREELRKQRDELLVALERARPHIGVGYSAIQRHEIISMVDNAIANARK
jgi:hypothetical protein